MEFQSPFPSVRNVASVQREPAMGDNSKYTDKRNMDSVRQSSIPFLRTKVTRVQSAKRPMSDGSLTTITRQVKCVESFAAIATVLLGLLVTIRKFFVHALSISMNAVAIRAKTLIQLAAVGLVCYGVALIFLPAALILGGVIVVTALEVR